MCALSPPNGKGISHRGVVSPGASPQARRSTAERRRANRCFAVRQCMAPLHSPRCSPIHCSPGAATSLPGRCRCVIRTGPARAPPNGGTSRRRLTRASKQGGKAARRPSPATRARGLSPNVPKRRAKHGLASPLSLTLDQQPQPTETLGPPNGAHATVSASGAIASLAAETPSSTSASALSSQTRSHRRVLAHRRLVVAQR